jgi:hypothetical protein
MKTYELQSLHGLLFPEPISSHFEVKNIKEFTDNIEIRLEELAELVPHELIEVSGKIILDGFCNPVELQSFPLKGKAVNLKLYRRRWKEKGTSHHYSNSYTLHPQGVKATTDFASFLKEAIGQTTGEHNTYRNSFMH